MSIPIFAPTRTESYDQCQLRDHLQNTLMLLPRQAGNALLGQLVGRAFAKGMSSFHTGTAVADCTEQALDLFERSLVHYSQHGVVFDKPVQEMVDDSGLDTVLEKYAAENPFARWRILDVERQLPDHGKCRIDIGGYDEDGLLAVGEAKYKRYLKADYESSTIAEYLCSWQFMHYPWAYGDYRQENCYRIYLCLVVWKPRFYVKLVPHEVHPETQQIWLESAKAKWARMAQRDHTVPEMSTRHRDQYGWCPYYKACFQYHLDENQFGSDYAVVPRMQD